MLISFNWNMLIQKLMISNLTEFDWNQKMFLHIFLEHMNVKTEDHEHIHLLLATSCHCGKAAGTGPHCCP